MKRGLIVLIPFPFTDLTGHKPRPALVVSRTDRADSDIILAFITTQLAHYLPKTDLLLEDSHSDFHQTGLKHTSIVKLDKLVTLEYAMIMGELGELSNALLQEIDDRLKYVLELTS